MAEKHLLILETVKDAKSLLNKKYTIPISLNELDIISTQPDIQAYLLMNNIKCKNSADYMHPGDYSIINNKVEIIEKFISDCIRRKNQEIPSPWVTNSFTYYFRYLCYYLFWDVKLTTNILSNKHYASIIAFTFDGKTKSSPWVLPEERYLGEILKRIAEQRNINIFVIPVNDTRTRVKVTSSAFCKIVSWICYNIFRLGSRKFEKNKFIFIPNMSYNMDLLCNGLLNDNGNLKFCKLSTGLTLSTEIKNGFRILLFYLFNLKIIDRTKNSKIDL